MAQQKDDWSKKWAAIVAKAWAALPQKPHSEELADEHLQRIAAGANFVKIVNSE